MSRSAGTLRRRLAPSDKRVAHRMGSAAFFAPLMRTVPRSGPPARMRMASTIPFLFRLGVFLCPEARPELRRVSVSTNRHGCDQLRIATDEGPGLDRGRVLLNAVVVAKNGACPDVRSVADHAISE